MQIDRAISDRACARCVYIYVCALRVINAKNSRVIAPRTNNEEAINIAAIHARGRAQIPHTSSLFDCRAITRGGKRHRGSPLFVPFIPPSRPQLVGPRREREISVPTKITRLANYTILLGRSKIRVSDNRKIKREKKKRMATGAD